MDRRAHSAPLTTPALAFTRICHPLREAIEPRVVTVVQRRFQPREWTPVNTLIILAGGRGSRTGAAGNKVYSHARGRPLLWYPLTAIASFDPPVSALIVIRPEDEEAASAVASEFEDHLEIRLVHGGPTRHDSELAGLAAMAGAAKKDDLIGIHDAARPFLTAQLWSSCAAAARSIGGAIPVIEAGPLHRLVEGGLTPLTTTAYKAQTPQVFNASGLQAAFRGSSDPAPDTAATVLRHGNLQIAAVAGDRRNIKVTYPSDLEQATELAGMWQNGRWLAVV